MHLLRLIPLACLRADKPARFDTMPTEFGPLSLTVQLDAAGRELQVTFAPKFRTAPERLLLHVPPVKGLAAIRRMHPRPGGRLIFSLRFDHTIGTPPDGGPCLPDAICPASTRRRTAA